MVATVTPLRSSANAVSYFEKDGYYARDDPEHRDASFWQGGAAREAGLRGHDGMDASPPTASRCAKVVLHSTP
jgi:hypothetical protein